MDDKQKSKTYFNQHSKTFVNRNGYWSYDYHTTSKILQGRNVKNLLDIGCGSGILSIISLILGAEHATAVDIDENCVHVAYENLEMNGISADKYTVLSGDILSDGELFDKIAVEKYDVVAANIVADVIIALLPIAEKLVKDGGAFVCSGIIDERLADVESALSESHFSIEKITHNGGWSSVLCKLVENS